MIDPNLVSTVDSIRSQYLQVVQALEGVPSFDGLLTGSDRLRGEWADCQAIARSPRVSNPCVPTFSCAFVGSSGHGKTSILAEMFPDLARRNWLGTDVTDTTSQALIIRHTPHGSPTADRVLVRSWDIEQIRRLVDAARAENTRTNITIGSYASEIEVDGTEARFEESDRRKFKFPLKQQLRPLPRPYEPTPQQVADPAFIRALTIKEPSDRVKRGPVIVVDNWPFEALPLRAAVKEVELREPFTEILRWAGDEANRAAELVFIDTPGLKVAGSIKDEVLIHILGKKNQQIIVELLRNDELDIIVHLVLCTQQSSFAELYKAVSEQCSPEELADLGDRLILAINGTNLYFTNADLKRKWTSPEAARLEGDHFAVTLEDNILKKMSERGTARPARICFLDSKRIVEDAHGDYATFYGSHRLMLDFWCSPQAPCHSTLERLGLVRSLKENIEALCDPGDRGQGYLVRQVLDLVRQNGPRLFVRKNVVRSRLQGGIRQLREALLRSYDTTGQLNFQAIQDAIRSCLSVLDSRDLSSIERFAARALDPQIDEFVPLPGSQIEPERWISLTFAKVSNAVYRALVEESGANAQAKALFTRVIQERLNRWRKAWGYSNASMPPPTRQNPTPADLLRHSLKLHVREMLYQLLTDSSSVSSTAIAQAPEDREAVQKILATLDDISQQAESLVRQLGGAIA